MRRLQRHRGWPNGAGSAYRAINSCLVFLPMVAGQEIYTVESLASEGQLADVQRLWLRAAVRNVATARRDSS